MLAGYTWGFDESLKVIKAISGSVSIVSVVAGVVISVLSFNATRRREAESKRVEAAKPFLELRQKLYQETVKAAAVLSDPENHSEGENKAAYKRFRELYISELSMVESKSVEGAMKAAHA